VDHYVALAKFSGKGIETDVTAFRLAAHGFGCERLRPALLRHFNITEPVAVPHLELTSDRSGDVAFEHVEHVAREIASEFASIAPIALRKIFKALQRNAAKIADQLDGSSDGDDGDAVFYSFLVSSACYFFGGDFYNAQAMAAVCGLEPSTVDPEHLELFNAGPRIESADIDHAYLTLPIEQIVAMADFLREAAPKALEYLELDDLTESEIDFVCAVFSPFVLHVFKLFRAHVGDVDDEGFSRLLRILDDDLAPFR